MKYKIKELDEIKKTLSKTKIKKYSDLGKLLAKMYGTTVKELQISEHFGVTGEGKEIKFKYEDLLHNIELNGCYAFCDVDRNTINVWIDKNVNSITLFEMLSHEFGHMIGPQYKSDLKDEIKAEKYSLCAVAAFLANEKLKKEGDK